MPKNIAKELGKHKTRHHQERCGDFNDVEVIRCVQARCTQGTHCTQYSTGHKQQHGTLSKISTGCVRYSMVINRQAVNLIFCSFVWRKVKTTVTAVYTAQGQIAPLFNSVKSSSIQQKVKYKNFEKLSLL